MRELEFLPTWYPMLRQKRRRVFLQLWLSTVIVFGLGLWMALSERNVNAAQGSMNTLKGQLQQADDQLRKLGELETIKKQLSQQAEVVARLGPHVATSRIIDVLDQTMPDGMALLDLTLDTQLQERPASALTAAAGKGGNISRHVVIHLHGVAPSDDSLGEFVARLSNVPHFSDTAPIYSKDRVEGGHLMREFEVDCVINLNENEN